MRLCLFGDARSIHLRRLAAGLATSSTSVHVVSHHDVPIPGVSVERFQIPRAGLLNPRRWNSRWHHYLAAFFRRFDVVHVHFLHDWGFGREQVTDRAFVVSPWGSDITPPPGEDPPTPETTSRRQELLASATAVTAWGPWFARRVADFSGLVPERIDVLPLGVDTRLFRPGVVPRRTLDRSRIVGFCKGFRPVYGASLWVQAMPYVRRRHPDVRFQMIGDGMELDRCRTLAVDLDVNDRIRWLPRQSHERLPALIGGWSLTVIPSLQESFGALALESSAMGVPVVASEVGGLRDTVIHNRTGLRVPPADPAAIAGAVTALLQQDGTRQAMGVSGRDLVIRNYEWSDVLRRWVDLYLNVRDRVGHMV